MSQPSPSANRQGALCSCSCEQRGHPPTLTSDPNGWFYGRPLPPLNLFCCTAILHRRQASGKKRTKPKLFPLSKHSRWNIPPLHRLTTLHLSSESGTAQLNLVTCVRMLSSLSCLTLSDSMDHSPPGSCVHCILQARILEWVVMPSSRGSSWPRDRTGVSCMQADFFTHWAT